MRIGIGKPPGRDRAPTTCCAGRRAAERELLDAAVAEAADAVEASSAAGVDGGHEPLQRQAAARAERRGEPSGSSGRRPPARRARRRCSRASRRWPTWSGGPTPRWPCPAGPALRAGRPGAAVRATARCSWSRPTAADAERLAAGPRLLPRPSRRRAVRWRHLARLGDPSLRAGEPRGLHDGPAARRALAPVRRLERAARRGRRVVVAPVRALLQRLGPCEAAARPVVVAAGGRSTRPSCLERLVAPGYRREHQVEHRGEVAVRGGIVDVFPSTADVARPHRPVGRRGRPAHGLRRGDQRSVADLRLGHVFGCRELPVSDAGAGPGPTSCSTAEPWGASQWERLADGELFDGMESWLPWLEPDERLLTDLLGEAPRWCWSSRGGCATGRSSSTTRRARWPRPWPPPGAPALPRTLPTGSRACTAPSTVFFRTAERRPCRSAPVAEGPSMPAVAVGGFEPVAGDPARLAARRSPRWSRPGAPSPCAPPRGRRAAPRRRVLADEGVLRRR